MSVDFICAIAYNWHDSSVSFAFGKKIVLVLEAERVFRQKKMMCSVEQMEFLVKHGCNILGKTIDDIKLFALQTLGSPHLTKDQRQSKPPFWTQVNLFGIKRKCLIVNHHLAHAAAFLFSPFSDALILTCDGGGDFGERVSAYYGKGCKLEKLETSAEGFISAKIYDLCSSHIYSIQRPTKDPYLTPPRAEGKMMALSSYGNINSTYLDMLKINEHELCTTNYQNGYDLLCKLFPGLLGAAIKGISATRDFAASVQYYFVKRRIEDISNYLKSNLSSNIVLSGGAHLNLELNSSIFEMNPNLFIPPCCDDTGQSLGALSILISEAYKTRPEVSLPFLGEGSEFAPNVPESVFDKLIDKLRHDHVILVHNGKSEIGPRALGNRSFIARADSIHVKKMLSENIKNREWYRPVAPVVLKEKVTDYYIGPDKSPYMLYSYGAKEVAKSLLPATIHVDGSARVQTVSINDNPFMYKLLKRWGDETGHPVLLNTSLNLKGMPLSNTPNDTHNISSSILYENTVLIDGEIV